MIKKKTAIIATTTTGPQPVKTSGSRQSDASRKIKVRHSSLQRGTRSPNEACPDGLLAFLRCFQCSFFTVIHTIVNVAKHPIL